MGELVRLDFRPRSAPVEQDEPAEVIRPTFVVSELQKLDEELEALSDLPAADDYEAGKRCLFADGETVRIIQRVDGDAWRTLVAYRQETIVSYLLERKAARRRIEERMRRARCDHDFGEGNKAKRCRRCDTPRLKAWTVCGSRPQHWSHTMNIPRRCRRRTGHEGKCSWERAQDRAER